MRMNPGERSLIRYLAIYRPVCDLVDLQRFNFNVTALRIARAAQASQDLLLRQRILACSLIASCFCALISDYGIHFSSIVADILPFSWAQLLSPAACPPEPGSLNPLTRLLPS